MEKKEKLKDKASIRFKMLKRKYAEMLNNALKENKVDKQLIPFLKKVNSLDKFFTASSCAGRIILLETNTSESKKESKFIFKKHGKVSFEEIFPKIRDFDAKDKYLWFKQEPFILHIGTDTLENAKKIITAMRNAGIKRGGIMVAQEGKYIIELLGTQSLSLLVKYKDFQICENCFRKQLQIANKKLERNYRRLKLFEKEFLKVS